MFHQKDRSIDNFSKNSIRHRVYEYDDMEITKWHYFAHEKKFDWKQKKKSEYNLQNPYKNL